MKTWEHDIVAVKIEFFGKHWETIRNCLAERGALGWELTSTVRLGEPTRPFLYMFFKRPKEAP